MAAPCLSMFQPIKTLGAGAFGQVSLVRKICGMDRGIFYALKTIVKNGMRGKLLDHTLAEREALELTRECPFICKLHYAFQSPNCLFYAMEYVEGGTLYDLMKKRHLIEYEVMLYTSEMVLAIEFMHSIGIIHRDIKPENILVTRFGHIKVADFGACKLIKGGGRTFSYCGTLDYMAPEMLTRNGHGREVDWWALGVIMHELLVAKWPFSRIPEQLRTSAIRRCILNTQPTLSFFLYSPEVQDLIMKLLEKDYKHRIGTSRGAVEVKEHPFFDRLNWNAVQARLYQPLLMPDVDQSFLLKVILTPMPNFFYDDYLERRLSQDDLIIFEGFEYVAPFVNNMVLPSLPANIY